MENAMALTRNTVYPQVGSPAPNRETSPIVGEDDEVEAEPNVSGTACTFNGVEYPIGAYVLSGTEVLRCEPPGLWVREGELPSGSKMLD
jgi:hypothetical protein